MAKIIKIEQYEQQGKEVVLKGTKEVTIGKMKPFQFMMVTKNVKELVDDINEDPQIKNALSGLIGEIDEDMDFMEMLRQMGVNVLQDMFGSVATLLETVPDFFFAVISNASGIEKGQLQYQDTDIFFDIIDAVLEENDFSKVYARVKKSTSLLRRSLNFRLVAEQADNPQVKPMTNPVTAPTLIE